VKMRFKLVNDWRVLGHKDEAFDTCSCCVCGRSTASIAGRRKCNAFHSQPFRHADRGGHASTFEPAGWQLGLIPYVESRKSKLLSQTYTRQERRHAFAKGDWLDIQWQRQEFAITPEGWWPFGKCCWSDCFPNLVQVVPHPNGAAIVHVCQLPEWEYCSI